MKWESGITVSYIEDEFANIEGVSCIRTGCDSEDSSEVKIQIIIDTKSTMYEKQVKHTINFLNKVQAIQDYEKQKEEDDIEEYKIYMINN